MTLSNCSTPKACPSPLFSGLRGAAVRLAESEDRHVGVHITICLQQGMTQEQPEKKWIIAFKGTYVSVYDGNVPYC